MTANKIIHVMASARQETWWEAKPGYVSHLLITGLQYPPEIRQNPPRIKLLERAIMGKFVPCELLDEWPDAPGSWPEPVEEQFAAKLRAYRKKREKSAATEDGESARVVRAEMKRASFEVVQPATAGLDGVTLGSTPHVETLTVDKQLKPKPPPRKRRQKAATP